MSGFSLSARVDSLRHACRGIVFMVRSQHNAWVHLSATILVVAIGLWVDITAADWKWLVATIATVWIAETMNTAFEHLCDVVSPDFHNGVKRCKDVAAAAVLIAALGALAMGGLVFLPYLFGDGAVVT